MITYQIFGGLLKNVPQEIFDFARERSITIRDEKGNIFNLDRVIKDEFRRFWNFRYKELGLPLPKKKPKDIMRRKCLMLSGRKDEVCR
ncbi:hypothetical protein [Thermoactinomyces sp. CICC 23799]|jgi:transcription initiation factor TFIIIB Brf1 subunit/transcription initiation factor TFIIB|uniref:hypothetical protein n=1 Tax=Thermoactinomyces sp. CICC 23799 TaxID=2767429 RepID=UPI0018DD81C0|nr:hypothetical protein [Thermoactinomyces sp. CICC 23799]MBH8602518.1 hypothetical protein [Thermoactinomyces sp. CICC 23799]